MATKEKILVIDDEEDIILMMRMILEYEGYECFSASRGNEGIQIALKEKPDAIFLDLKMPQMDGYEIYDMLRAKGIVTPVIIISGHGNVTTAVDFIKRGAFDFLEKPLEREKILITLRNALEQKKLKEENIELKLRFEEKYRMIGSSKYMMHLKEQMQKIAPTNSTVLITGESGTGKELVAHAIHKNSRRGSKQFIKVNCAAIPEELIESELFGHIKGSFTGAFETKQGKFEQANEGTIFLDEIGDMSSRTQSKVLRVLEEGELEKIGSQKPIKVEVRIIAATNKNLGEEIEKGTFREDLYYRLNVMVIPVLPLREHPEDVPELIEYFTNHYCKENNFASKKFSSDALDELKKHQWKGNIRELRNIVERLLLLSQSAIIEKEEVIATLPERKWDNQVVDFLQSQTLKSFRDSSERYFIIRKLEENNWNIAKTAKKIRTPRSNLYKKLEQYKITIKKGVSE
ncbi:MAG: Fis family transcriptional regulator [Candidatus Fischerbacteria bacterium RBG_13_37_8]|uniref:Fis family transcriptional regulator n=1 Tax=Candidatus Fischerbacteria bacterium RBG_13_37_8 TaxID=1817863 RepID=A0A1F5VUB0_9BACT|nr:MAG: Fis family transcriptional regulator [Candidatus Fischerbacteria bacterium RBG_13_37_8]